MGWLPQFLWTSSDASKHLDILVNKLRELNAHTALPDSPLKNVYDSLQLINTVAQGRNSVFTTTQITDAVKNVIINITLIQASLVGPHLILRTVLLQTIDTLGTWCYQEGGAYTPNLTLHDIESESATLIYGTALQLHCFTEEKLSLAINAMRTICKDFKNNYTAAENKRDSGIFGAVLGAGIALVIIFFTIGTGDAPLWLSIGAPSLFAFIGSHLMEYISTPPAPTPGIDVAGGSSANMGPFRPYSGTSHKLNLDPSPELETKQPIRTQDTDASLAPVSPSQFLSRRPGQSPSSSD